MPETPSAFFFSTSVCRLFGRAQTDDFKGYIDRPSEVIPTSGGRQKSATSALLQRCERITVSCGSQEHVIFVLAALVNNIRVQLDVAQFRVSRGFCLS